MRSVVVVLLASMWAMMPMFRYFSSGVSRAIYGPEERLRFVFQARVFVDLLRMPALFTPTKTRVDRTPQLEGWYPSAAAGCTRFCYGRDAASAERIARRLVRLRQPRRACRRERHLAPARAHGVQGHGAAHRAAD